MHEQQPAVACSCTSPAKPNRLVRWMTAGGILSAVGICAACCLLPFTFLSIGIAGAWVGTLDALAPYKWIFIVLAAALLGYGFYVVYWKAKPACAAGPACKSCRSDRPLRVALWAGTVLALASIAFEQVEPYLAR